MSFKKRVMNGMEGKRETKKKEGKEVFFLGARGYGVGSLPCLLAGSRDLSRSGRDGVFNVNINKYIFEHLMILIPLLSDFVLDI